MSRRSGSLVIPPLKDPKLAFRKKKDKTVGESSNNLQSNNFESFEKTHEKKAVDHEPETPKFETKSEPKPEVVMPDITDMMTEEYKKRMRDNTGSGLVQPTIPAAANFKLKGHILAQLKDIPFYKKDHKDDYKHIDEVNEIADYFKIPNVPREKVQLRMLPITFKGAAKD